MAMLPFDSSRLCAFTGDIGVSIERVLHTLERLAAAPALRLNAKKCQAVIVGAPGTGRQGYRTQVCIPRGRRRI